MEWADADADTDIGLDRVVEQMGAVAQFAIENAVQNEAKLRAFSSQLSRHSSLLHVLMQKTNRVASLLLGLLDYFDVGHAKKMLEEKNDSNNHGVDYISDAADMV